MKLDVLILFESQEREIESACLLKEELIKRGYNVIVKSVYPNKEKYIFKYNPKLIISPWVYNENDMKYFSCFYIHKNTKILNLHHEQYSGENSENACIPEGEAKNVYHISWGKEFTKELIESGCKTSMICQAGNIRLDFFKKDFLDMSKTKEELAKEFNIDLNKKWVLFIANGYHLAGEKEINNMMTIDKKAKIKADISKKTRLEFLKYVDEYLKNNDDTVFIYRPHPVYSSLDMKQEEIVNLSNKYKGRFVCIFSYPIRNWIINSNLIMSFHSTCGVECFAAEKRYLLFRPFEFPKTIDYEFYYDYPYVIKDYDSFYNYIKAKETKPQLENIYNQYFDITPNKYTYIQICDFVDYIFKDKNDVVKRKAKLKNLIYMFIKMSYKSIIYVLSRFNKKYFENIKDTRYSHMIKNAENDNIEKNIYETSTKLKQLLKDKRIESE